jgi:phosphonate metabolism-associated iron-containing alcohol dehydrogenase
MFGCPTRVYSNLDFNSQLAELVERRRVLLMTSQGWVQRGLVCTVARQLPIEPVVAAAVRSHPRVRDVIAIEKAMPEFDVVLAVGGGSVLDAAKAVIALRAIDSDADRFQQVLTETSSLPAELNCYPLIAVPTTSGTGSEVTPTGTLWGERMEKYSVAHQALLPHTVLLDPSLALSMPQDVTLCSGLDALSHAMEAIWNRNATPASDFAAAAAIRALKVSLPKALGRPDSLHLRREVQVAALYAGYAIGSTRTALAHSMSYPLTAACELPHGFACSFTLGEVARFNAVTHPERLAIIAEALGYGLEELPDQINAWLRHIGLPAHLRSYLAKAHGLRFGADLINPSRAANNVRPADANDARGILERSLGALLPA